MAGFNALKARQARHDAYRYVEAEMNYGEGSRIERRNVRKDIEIKCKDPEYKILFDIEVSKVDRDQVYRRLRVLKAAKEKYEQGKKGVRLFRKANRLFYDLLEILG